jgi:hypothetical protein
MFEDARPCSDFDQDSWVSEEYRDSWENWSGMMFWDFINRWSRLKDRLNDQK